MKIYLILLFFLSLIIISCSKNDSAVNPPPAPERRTFNFTGYQEIYDTSYAKLWSDSLVDWVNGIVTTSYGPTLRMINNAGGEFYFDNSETRWVFSLR